MKFNDHFSEQARQYARHRPGYPAALFEFLASIAPARELAWDCGTGNGQVAIALAERFDHVVATDASAEQIANAFPHERVVYRVEPAEATTFESKSVDLITVGTAVHWFTFDSFYSEVRRVGKQGAVLAVWAYQFPVISPEIDQWLERFYGQTLGGYWPEQIRFLEQHYGTLPFPFEEIEPPGFVTETHWKLSDLAGFIDSWSATRKYLRDNGHHPLDGEMDKLGTLWGAADRPRTLRWPLYFRIGRLPG